MELARKLRSPERLHEELLELLALNPRPIWQDIVWGGRVLLARGEVDGAIEYVQSRAGKSVQMGALARFGESALLTAGRRQDAYAKYAIEANQAQSRLAKYRAIAKKYPEIAPERLLRDLIQSTPGEEGKWFATAKTLKRFDLALALARTSPCEPKTLARAARDAMKDRPAFSLQAAMAALFWIAAGSGYEITALDALEARRLAVDAATREKRLAEFERWLGEILASERPGARWLKDLFARHGS
jgi:hypothetical protein